MRLALLHQARHASHGHARSGRDQSGRARPGRARAGHARLSMCALAVVAIVGFAATATPAPLRPAIAAQPPDSGPQQQDSNSQRLHELIDRGLAVSVTSRDEAGYLAAADEYRSLLGDLASIQYEHLDLDDQVDHDLVEAYMNTRIFEYEEVQSFKINPGSYISLWATSRLFLRPEANTNSDARAAVAELRGFGDRLEEGKRNLTIPARTWTENAIYQAYYANLLLTEYVPKAQMPRLPGFWPIMKALRVWWRLP